MIFVTVIGGIGTLEGPIVGTIVFYALQQTLSDQGAWYLVLLGVVAIAIAIWSPQRHLGRRRRPARPAARSRSATGSRG